MLMFEPITTPFPRTKMDVKPPDFCLDMQCDFLREVGSDP